MVGDLMFNKKLKQKCADLQDERDELLGALLSIKHVCPAAMLQLIQLPSSDSPEVEGVVYTILKIFAIAFNSSDTEAVIDHLYQVAHIAYDDDKKFKCKTDSAEYMLRQYFLKHHNSVFNITNE